jgi:hypothetical protein
MSFLETHANRELLSDSRALFLTLCHCTLRRKNFDAFPAVDVESTRARPPHQNANTFLDGIQVCGPDTCLACVHIQYPGDWHSQKVRHIMNAEKLALLRSLSSYGYIRDFSEGWCGH